MVEQFHLIDAMLPWFWPAVVLVFGACVGSFLNVCIYRIPAEQSVVFPGSHCGCGAPIAWYDNVPVLSWILLRGKARCCGRPFSLRYPVIEALTAGLFAGCWLVFPPFPALAAMAFCGMMVAASFIDLDHMIIPDRFSIGGFVVGVVLSGAFPALHGFTESIFMVDSMRAVLAATVGGFIGSALILWIGIFGEIVFRKEAMGFGDVKLMGAIGAFCGWEGAVFAVFGGSLIGSVLVLGWMIVSTVLRRRRPAGGGEAAAVPDDGTEDAEPVTAFGTRIPFGPMLALGGTIYLLGASRWIDPWFHEMVTVFLPG